MFAASKTIGCMTLFVEDLQLARSFYSDVFGKPLVFEDPRCAIFDFGSTLINLLAAPAAVGLIAPAPVGGAGHRRPLSTHHVGRRCRRGLHGAERSRRQPSEWPDGPSLGTADGDVSRSRWQHLGGRRGIALLRGVTSPTRPLQVVQRAPKSARRRRAGGS
jgi:catechol 2,3-dioxygenase-like lactoylglutathione lyase family enzyme